MSPLLQMVSEAHILITIIIEFSLFTLANFCAFAKKDEVCLYRAFLLPVLITFTIFVFTNTLSSYKLILIAETLFFILVAIYSIIKSKLNTIFILILGVAIPLVLIYTDYLAVLSDVNIMYYGIAHISSIVLYFLINMKIKGADNAEKIHFVNAIATLVLLFFYNQDGSFFMLAIRIFYFIVLYTNIVVLCKTEKEVMDKKFAAIKEDFDDEVRREVKSQLFYMEISREQMSEIAKLDDMTKVYNKKTILNFIKEDIQDKKVKTFSLLIFDIDNFKNINDSYGHIQGDKCIIQLARMAEECLRDNDKIGRYGGDEFFAIISGADLTTAAQVAERLRKKVETTNDPHYTISIGIANYPNDAENQKDLIKYADDGLYIAKNKGRNSLGYLPKKTKDV